MTWTKAALIRVVRTMAEAALAIIGSSVAMGDVNWTLVLSASVLAGIVSLLMALAGLPEVTKFEYDDEVDDDVK